MIDMIKFEFDSVFKVNIKTTIQIRKTIIFNETNKSDFE